MESHTASAPFSPLEWLRKAQQGEIEVGHLIRFGPLGHRDELLAAILNHGEGLSPEQWVSLCGGPWFVTREELKGYAGYQLEMLAGRDPHKVCLEELNQRRAVRGVSPGEFYLSGPVTYVGQFVTAESPDVTFDPVLPWKIEERIRHLWGRVYPSLPVNAS